MIVRLAGAHMASPAVWRAVEGAADVPDEVRMYFQAVHELNAQRNLMILNGLEDVLSVLAASGIKSVLLKGGASVVSGLYGDPAERLLTDIDLLIAPKQVAAARDALRVGGYTDALPVASRWAKARHHHFPPLVPPNGGFCVELHRSPSSGEFKALLPPAEILERAVQIQWNAVSLFIPSATDRVVHNIVHAQLNDRRFSRGLIELRQLRELALLAKMHWRDIDWSEVERRFRAAGFAQVLAEQGALSQVLMGVVFPAGNVNEDLALDRLREGLTNAKGRSEGGLSKLARVYLLRFVRHPQLALNLLNPRWWPERLRSMRRLLKGDDDTMN